MRTQQPAVSVATQKVTFSASACLLYLFEISLDTDQTEIVFSFHAGGSIIKPRFGCNNVAHTLLLPLLMPRKLPSSTLLQSALSLRIRE